MKNVLVDMHRLKQNPYNGLYTFSYNLGKNLSKLVTPALQLYYYLPRNKYGLFGNDVKYVAHHSLDKFYMTGTSRFDVWHATTNISWYRPFNKSTRFIFTIHDLNFLLEDKLSNKRNQALLRRMQTRINRSDHLTFISKYAMNIADQHLDLGDRPKTVIYNGCNMYDFGNFNQPKYKPSRPFLFTIGLVQPRKNFHLLPALLQRNDYELVIAGLDHYNYKKEVEAAIKKWNVADRVTFTGAISEEEKYWYYKNCTAFLFPSFAEGFGLPAIEAMHFGKPVFLSTETSLPEIGGDAAYYFDVLQPEAMQLAFEKGMNHYQMNHPEEKIMQRSALFSWDEAANQYLNIYKSL